MILGTLPRPHVLHYRKQVAQLSTLTHSRAQTSGHRYNSKNYIFTYIHTCLAHSQDMPNVQVQHTLGSTLRIALEPSVGSLGTTSRSAERRGRTENSSQPFCFVLFVVVAVVLFCF